MERMVPYVRDSFFSGRRLHDLRTMRSQAPTWSATWPGSARPSLGWRRAEAIFAALEPKRLLALPRRAFELASWQTAKVAPDCHLSRRGALYSVPFRFIGAAPGRTAHRHQGCSSTPTRARQDARCAVRKGRRATDWQDYPPRRRPSSCAPRPGAATGRGDRAGGQRPDHRAPRRAGPAPAAQRPGGHPSGRLLRGGAPRGLPAPWRSRSATPAYRTVRGILKAGREQLSAEQETPAPRAPAHLHGPDTLFAHLEA